MTAITAPAEPYTVQTAYEAIRAYFTRPGAELSRAEPDETGDAAPCYYRHPDDGRACAVGCLIPDELYQPKWEGTAAHAILEQLPGLIVARETTRFLEQAQGYHDDALGVDDFIVKLDTLAEFYGAKVVK